MPTIETMRAHAVAAFKLVPNARFYALDEAAIDSLAALAFVWHESRAGESFSREELADLFGQVAKVVPGLVKQKSDPTTAQPPAPWVDPVTSETAKNPWGNPPDLESQGVLVRREPALAEHLKRIAEKGVTYSMLAELRDKEESRQRAAAIVYGEAEHKGNPWITGNVTDQMKLQKSDPELAEFYKLEAGPLRLPWQPGVKNFTLLGRLTTVDPQLAALTRRASELQAHWAADRLATAKEAEATAREELKKAEALLHGR